MVQIFGCLTVVTAIVDPSWWLRTLRTSMEVFFSAPLSFLKGSVPHVQQMMS